MRTILRTLNFVGLESKREGMVQENNIGRNNDQ